MATPTIDPDRFYTLGEASKLSGFSRAVLAARCDSGGESRLAEGERGRPAGVRGGGRRAGEPATGPAATAERGSAGAGEAESGTVRGPERTGLRLTHTRSEHVDSQLVADLTAAQLGPEPEPPAKKAGKAKGKK